MSPKPNTRPGHARIAAVAVAALVCASSAYAAGLVPSAGQATADHDAAIAKRSALRLSARASGLYPGARRRLTVRVANRYRFNLRVSRLRVRVLNARRGCSGRYLTVGRLRRPLLVRARRVRRLKLTVRMSPRAPDACKRATFRLRLRATGHRSRR